MTKRAILVSLLLVSAGAVTAAPLVDGDVEAGAEAAAVCAACHGSDGNSSSAEFPKLAGQNANYIFRQLQLFKSGEREDAVMNAQAQPLDEQEMKNLAVYYAAQEIEPEVVSDFALAQKGAKIYHGGDPEHAVPACAGCHGPAGLGNPAAAYPRISGQYAEYLVEKLKAYRAGEHGNYAHAQTMSGVSRGLSNDDIKALAAYVSGLMPATDEQENISGALFQNPPEVEEQDEASGEEAESAAAEKPDEQAQANEEDKTDAGESTQSDGGDDAAAQQNESESAHESKKQQDDETEQQPKQDQTDAAAKDKESDAAASQDKSESTNDAANSDEADKEGESEQQDKPADDAAGAQQDQAEANKTSQDGGADAENESSQAEEPDASHADEQQDGTEPAGESDNADKTDTQNDSGKGG
ncbi:MAG TPA: c-type cytochrome [Salinisphaeraceae bacterium]|nr:c-type cytochrome [Salinisphaeraceae bacterium]